MRACVVYNLKGLVSYQKAWRFQRLLVEHKHQSRKLGIATPDYLILLQHESVYTLGRGASLDNVLFDSTSDNSHKLIRSERGGEVTWHGPGQLVVYPILDLNDYKRDLRWYTRMLEDCTIDCLNYFGIHSHRSEVNTGVWLGRNKISAIGIAASRWITMHGAAINIHCELSNFERIVPCGIVKEGYGVCRLLDIIQRDDTNESSYIGRVHECSPMTDEGVFWNARNFYLSSFASSFNVQLQVGSPQDLDVLALKYPAIASATIPEVQR